MSASGYEALRGSRRLKIFHPASLRSADGCVRIHLLDVSQTGMLGYGHTPPWPGERVELECAGLVVAATVRWRDRQRFGLEFATPLAAGEIDRLARAGGALSLAAPAPVSPQLASVAG